MKKKIIIALSCILIVSITIFIIAHSSKYDRVTRDDEKTIIFVRCYENFNNESGKYTIKALDNYGNIYHLFTDKSLTYLIENGEIFGASVVGHVSVDEAMKYYNRLRRMDDEMSYIYTEDYYLPEAPTIVYYGIRYVNGKMEFLNIGTNQARANKDVATEIAEWMEDWEWENK